MAKRTRRRSRSRKRRQRGGGDEEPAPEVEDSGAPEADSEPAVGSLLEEKDAEKVRNLEKHVRREELERRERIVDLTDFLNLC